MLTLVTSVEVSSSSEEKPSLCSARFPFCSLACLLRVLMQSRSQKQMFRTDARARSMSKPPNLLTEPLTRAAKQDANGSKAKARDVPPSFSLRYPPLAPLLLVRCSVSAECV